MAHGDIPRLNISETVREFLHDILEDVIGNLGESSNVGNKTNAQHILDNMVQGVVKISEEETAVRVSQNRVINSECSYQTEDKMENKSDMSADNVSKRKESSTIPVSIDLTNSEAIAKSYLESRVDFNQGADGAKRAADKTSIKALMNEYAQHASKAREQRVQVEEKAQINLPQMKTITDSLERDANKTITTSAKMSVITQDSDQIEHVNSIHSRESDHTEEFKANETKDRAVKSKLDDVEEERFPKFHKVKRKNTRLGKVQIYYNGDLDKEEKKRIVKEAKELYQYVKDKEKQEKEQRQGMERTRAGFGVRFRRFFGRFSCCNKCHDQ